MNCTAVIIDDEPCVRDVLKALGHWNELGITVVGEAEDGIAGLELVTQLKPDIVISDVVKPHAKEAIASLKALRKAESTLSGATIEPPSDRTVVFISEFSNTFSTFCN